MRARARDRQMDRTDAHRRTDGARGGNRHGGTRRQTGEGGGGSDRPALSSSPSIARNNIVMPAHPQSEATR